MKNLDSIIKKHLSSLKEEQIMENYMFFGNLKQIHRQCTLRACGYIKKRMIKQI